MPPVILALFAAGRESWQREVKNDAFGWWFVLFVALVLVCSLGLSLLLRRHYFWPVPIALLLIFHPYWTVETNGGDAGRVMAEMSAVAGIVAAFCLAGQVLHWAWVRTHGLPPASP